MARTIEQARQVIADRANARGESAFAREVIAGVWDDRGDVQAALRSELAIDLDDGGHPGPCSDPGGHEWPRDIEESERCLCVHCGADGDA